MPLVLSDEYRVIKHLKLAPSKIGEVHEKAEIVNRSELLCQMVLTVLEKLDELEEAIATEQSSTSFALTKADVVEWAPGQRTSGMEQLKLAKAYELAQYMDIPIGRHRAIHTSSMEFQAY